MPVRPVGALAAESTDEWLQGIADAWTGSCLQELDGQGFGLLADLLRPLDQGLVQLLGYVQSQGMAHGFLLDGRVAQGGVGAILRRLEYLSRDDCFSSIQGGSV